MQNAHLRLGQFEKPSDDRKGHILSCFILPSPESQRAKGHKLAVLGSAQPGVKTEVR